MLVELFSLSYPQRVQRLLFGLSFLFLLASCVSGIQTLLLLEGEQLQALLWGVNTLACGLAAARIFEGKGGSDDA